MPPQGPQGLQAPHQARAEAEAGVEVGDLAEAEDEDAEEPPPPQPPRSWRPMVLLSRKPPP